MSSVNPQIWLNMVVQALVHICALSCWVCAVVLYRHEMLLFKKKQNGIVKLHNTATSALPAVCC